MVPSFPAATVTTTPALLAFSNISVSGYFSPSIENPADEPRLILTTSAPREIASSIAFSHISVKVVGYCKSSENTLSASICAFGATPYRFFSLSLAPTIPDTCIPCITP